MDIESCLMCSGYTGGAISLYGDICVLNGEPESARGLGQIGGGCGIGGS